MSEVQLTPELKPKYRLATLRSLFVLMVILCTSWILRGADMGNLDVLGLMLLPLFFLWPWIARGNDKAYFWLDMLLMLYVVKAVTGITQLSTLLAALAELAATLTTFWFAYRYLRCNPRLPKLKGKSTPDN